MKKREKEKGAYFSVITHTQSVYLVEIPDFGIFTEANTLEDAIEMGRDAIGEMALARMDKGISIPKASINVNEVLRLSEYSDLGTQVTTLIDIDFVRYRQKSDNKAVRRNVTIPNWLNTLAEESGLNVSKVLQEALMQKLNVYR